MNKLLKLIIFLTLFIVVNDIHGQNKPTGLELSLSNATGIKIEGPHRFIKIAGIDGLQVTSLKTKAWFETSFLNSDKGTLSLWMSPIEDINKFPLVGSSENMVHYPLISDHFPLYESDSCAFSLYYSGNHYPRVIGRFTKGSFWGQMDYGLAPFVYAEDLPLKKGQWYFFALTWDKPAGTLKMYINGELVGHNFSAKSFLRAGNRLYIGNPLMVLSNLKIQSDAADKSEIITAYQQLRPMSNTVSENTIREIVIPQTKPAISFKPDASWKKAYECSFTDPEEFKKWTFQTGDLYRNKFKLEITKDGLYFETPDIIHTESRGYLWCPVSVEGDQWIEYEFQLLSPKGLALIIMCASGLQGEDIINDHGLMKTGAMRDMLTNYRNYHWEYMRRVEAMRTDVETQYVAKNPWGKGLYVGCIPRLDQNRWYKMQFIKKGNRLYGAIDGKTVFEIEDDPYDNNGPLFNSGRVVLRQMYHTIMRYRNFVIYTKDNN